MSQRRFWALAPRACTQLTTFELSNILPASLSRLAAHVRALSMLSLLIEVKYHGWAYALWLTTLAVEHRPAAETGALQALLVLKCQRK